MIGHVKFFDPGRRYGFIVPDGKRARDKEDNVFFYETAITTGVRGVIDGAEVEYELIPHVKDAKALSVRLTGRAYAPVHELRKGVAHGD